jgi:hypothetical protein
VEGEGRMSICTNCKSKKGLKLVKQMAKKKTKRKLKLKTKIKNEMGLNGHKI